MRTAPKLTAVLLLAFGLAPAWGATGEGGVSLVARVSARLTHEGLATVGRSGRFSLPQFRIYDSQGQQVFEMNGFVPALFKSQVQQALAEPKPFDKERTLKHELAVMVDAEGRSLAALPDSDFTLVEYWAEWCAPCKLLGKQLDEVFAANQDHRLTLLKVEADPEKLMGGGRLPKGPVHVVDVAELDPETVAKLQSGELSQAEMDALMAEVVEAGALKRIDPSRLDPELREKLEGGELTPEELDEIIEKAGVAE
jgi:thiol-disulfide isomerase/thioredoxin